MPDAIHPTILINGIEMLDSFGMPRIFADRLTLELVPQFSTFEATFYYGEFSRGGKFILHPSLDLRGKFIDVKIGETILFSGIVERQADIPAGTRTAKTGKIRSGAAKIVAYSLDFLLSRLYVDNTVFAGFTTTKMFSFNETLDGFGYNRNKGTNEFALRQYSTSASSSCDPWYATNVLAYLLSNFTASSGFSFTLTGDTSALGVIIPQFNPAGMTVREAISEVLNPSRGYTWYVRRGTAALSAEIVVVSMSDVTITPEVVANSRPFDILAGIEENPLAENVAINAVEDSAYHQIRIVGAPIRVMATLKMNDSFSRGWTTSMQNGYNSAGDAGIYNPTYEPVYRTFYITEGWTQSDYKGNALCPVMNETTGTITWTNRATASALFEFDRDLPLFTYSSEVGNTQFQKPILFGSLDGVNLIPLAKSVVSMPVTFQPCDNKAGITLNSTYNHLCGKGYFTGTSEFSAIYNPTYFYLTVSWRSDVLLSYRITALAQLEGEPLKVKTINVPKAELWLAPYPVMMQPGTTAAVGTMVYPNRNDTSLLTKLARMAKAWYGRRRNSVSYDWHDLNVTSRIGQLINNVYSSGAFVPAGTVVTKEIFDFERQVVSLSSEFQDIDFSRIGSNSVNARDRLYEEGLRKLAEKVRNTPLGGNTPAEMEFKCPFQLQFIGYVDDVPKIKIFNGASPTSSYCGSNDVTGNVDVTTLTAQAGTIYFILKYSESGYSHEISYTLPASGSYVYDALGLVASVAGNWRTTQYWKSGNIIFRGRYFI